MELRRLTYFVRIAEEGSLGKASLSLGIAQPALGRHVKMLESELGVKLFRRTSKGMQLTDEGEYLRDGLRDPINNIRILLKNIRYLPNATEASLALGLPPDVARILGARIAARLYNEFPGLSLEIVERDSADLADLLVRRRIDIAILTSFVPSDKVYHYPGTEENLYLVAPANDEIACRDSIEFGELRNIPLLLPSMENTLRVQIEKICLNISSKIDIAMEVSSTDVLKQAVATGLGYTILPLMAFKVELDRGELAGTLIVEPTIPQTTRWATRPRWPVTRQLHDLIVKAILEEWSGAVVEGAWPAEWLFDIEAIGDSARLSE